MNNKFLLKAVVTYGFYCVCMTAIVFWTYLCRLYIPSFIILLFEILVIIGVLYNLLTRKKQKFLQEIDVIQSDELYGKITYPYYIQRGCCEVEKDVCAGAVVAIWIDEQGKKIYSVTIVKKDYIFDNDCSLTEQRLDVELFCNSYYKGEKINNEVINRRNIWGVYQKIKRNTLAK